MKIFDRLELEVTPLTAEKILGCKVGDKVIILGTKEIAEIEGFSVGTYSTSLLFSEAIEKGKSVLIKDKGWFAPSKLALVPKPSKAELIEAKRKELFERAERELEEFKEGLR